MTLAAGDEYVGIAPLGTAFTEAQADRLKPYVATDPDRVVIATDPDSAGWESTRRAFWRLPALRANPQHLSLPDGIDPADVLRTEGPEALKRRLETTTEFASELVDRLVEERRPGHSDPFSRVDLARAAARIIGALAPDRWLEAAQDLVERLDLSLATIHEEIYEAGTRWADDPQGCATRELAALRPVAPPANRVRTPRTVDVSRDVDSEKSIRQRVRTVPGR